MSFRIEMPQVGSEAAAEGEGATLAAWLVAEGDAVEKGQIIAELETDKSTLEVEAPVSGRIAELSVPAGTEDIEPGTLLGLIDPADEAVDGKDDGKKEGQEEGEASGDDAEDAPTKQAGADAGEARSEQAGADAGGAMTARAERGEDSGEEAPRRSTPLARRAAAERGIDVEGLEGSGPGGRVVEADVRRAAEGGSVEEDPGAAPVAAGVSGEDGAGEARQVASDASEAAGAEADTEVEVVRLSAMRKTIARRMTESKQQVPHFYLRVRCPMDTVMATRAKLNAGLAEEGAGVKISLNDFVIRAAALALRAVPEANVQFAGDAMHVFDRVDVAVAVATEGGLVTPVVRDADRQGLVSLAGTVRGLAEQAREGSLRPEQYQGGSFTISNLGMYGIETVYPILNPPQACILGVGAAEAQPVVRDGEIVVGHVACLTLAADHRAIDGAVGARLLTAVRERLEDPMSMVL